MQATVKHCQHRTGAAYSQCRNINNGRMKKATIGFSSCLMRLFKPTPENTYTKLALKQVTGDLHTVLRSKSCDGEENQRQTRTNPQQAETSHRHHGELPSFYTLCLDTGSAVKCCRSRKQEVASLELLSKSRLVSL